MEFGAADGTNISNTHILEKHFDWDGILSEPSVVWHDDLKANRHCSIETDCVWSKTNESLNFVEAGVLSTIEEFKDVDMHHRNSKKNYKVNTISLLDMLNKYKSPKTIDYLSIDTEGSEFEILSSFDFNEYEIKIITVEHNHTPMREQIFSLLTNHGYKRKYSEISGCDDWYVKN